MKIDPRTFNYFAVMAVTVWAACFLGPVFLHLSADQLLWAEKGVTAATAFIGGLSLTRGSKGDSSDGGRNSESSP